MRRPSVLLAFVVLGLAASAYLSWLGGQHIPKIGDEAVYASIVRKTAEARRWLPLATAEGLGQTKPPLLFWTGIVATRGGEAWHLFRLRLPIVLFTFATAAVAAWATARSTGSRRAGLFAALSFLAFASTFQYGRPFLTNLPETFFVFLPFAAAAARPSRLDGWPFWILAGVSTGLACLFKSFALVVPVAVAFAAWLLVRRPSLGTFLRRDLAKGVVATLLALGLFALWPLFDPDPRAILHEFVLGENVGKVGDGGWFAGLFSKTHGVWTTLLGPFFNAGFLAPAVVWLAWDAWRRGRKRTEVENGMWCLLLAFVVVFTLPGHRQANYLLPAMPALAVLLGTAWPRLPKLWLGASAFAVAVAALVGVGFQMGVARGVLPSGAYAPWQVGVPLATFLLAGFVAVRPRHARATLHALVFLAYLTLGAVLAPFEGPAGRFPPEAVAALRDRTVWVPSRFRSREERYRFLLPGADVRPYPEKLDRPLRRLRERGQIVAVQVPPDAPPPEDATVYGSRLDLRTRQTAAEIRALLFERRFDVLVNREILLRDDVEREPR